MTPTTLAETILRDVPKDALAKIVYDAMRFERQNDTPDWADGGNSCAQAEARHTAAKVQDAVLATLTAAMDPALTERAGEVLSRLRKADEYEPLGHDGWEAADLITALLAQNAVLRAEVEWWKQDSRAAWDKCEERRIAQEAAEAERDALRGERDRYLRHLTTGAESLNAYKARAEAAEAQIEALTARVEGLTGALHNCVGMLDCLVAESGRSIEWGQEDPFRMGEWFEPDDLKQLAQARAALSATTEAHNDRQA